MAMFRSGSARRRLLVCAALIFGAVPLVVGVQAAVRVSGAFEPEPTARAKAPIRRPSNSIALVIGNAHYPDASDPVVQTVNDARGLADALKSRGFDVDQHEDLSKAGMDQAIQAFSARVRPGMTVLISFGGYGLQVNRENYLLPVDATIWTPADVVRDGINLNAVLADLNGRGAAVKIVILDASRRGPFERRIRRVSSGLAPVQAPQSTLVLSAMTPGKTAEDTASDHGRVMSEVIDGLRRGRVNLETVFNRARMQVSTESGGDQVPSVTSSLTEDLLL